MGYASVDYQRGLEAAAASDLGLSGFWGDCPILEDLENGRQGFGHIYNGFHPIDVLTATGVCTWQPYNVYITATGTPSFGSTARIGGGMIVKTGTADNDEVTAQYGIVPVMEISDAANETFDMWYECLVETNNVSTQPQSGFFVGMCEPVTGVDSLIDADGTIDAARDLIGFFKPEGDDATFNIVYQKGAQTIVTVVDGSAASGDTLTAHTMVLNTVKRLGFRYRINAAAANKITFFIDGVEQGTYVTAANIAAATFPDSVAMLPTWGVTSGVVTTQHQIIVPMWGAYSGRALGTT